MSEKASKKARTEDNGEGNKEEAVNPEVMERLDKLQEVQDGLEKLTEEATERIMVIEQEYAEKRKPIYQKRSEIIKNIPDFWLSVFLSHPFLFTLITSEEQEALKYLKDLVIEDKKEIKSGFSIHFEFSSNPFVTNDVISKHYSFSEDGKVSVSATPIQWKEGKCLLKGKEEKEGEKGSKKKRPKAEDEEGADEGLFRWLVVDPSDPESQQEDELADLFKEDIWPNPLKYFGQDADDEDVLAGDELDDGEEDEEDEEEEGLEGDDDDDDNDDEEGDAE